MGSSYVESTGSETSQGPWRVQSLCPRASSTWGVDMGIGRRGDESSVGCEGAGMMWEIGWGRTSGGSDIYVKWELARISSFQHRLHVKITWKMIPKYC